MLFTQPKHRFVSRFLFVIISLSVVTSCGSTSSKTIGIAWRADLDSEFYTNICTAIKEAGGTPVLLKQARSTDVVYGEGTSLKDTCVDENGILKQDYATAIRANAWSHSNVKEIIGSIKTVVFTGGEDISPTLYATPEPWHGIEAEKDYNATRDVSDYLTMSYCVENDLKLMGFCRGMQMLGVYSGATVMQDIPTYFKEHNLDYHYEHRNEKVGDAYRDYAPHDVSVTSVSSKLYAIAGSSPISNVPSWHHQALSGVSGTKLTITATTKTDSLDMIEAIERTDKTYEMGLQFHPEAALVKHLEKAANQDKFMSYDSALKFFKALLA
jgi:putative glutamine amidotransferase